MKGNRLLFLGVKWQQSPQRKSSSKAGVSVLKASSSPQPYLPKESILLSNREENKLATYNIQKRTVFFFCTPLLPNAINLTKLLYIQGSVSSRFRTLTMFAEIKHILTRCGGTQV